MNMKKSYEHRLTPAIKGQLTKVKKTHTREGGHLFRKVREIFQKTLPPEQAKHAAKMYLYLDTL